MNLGSTVDGSLAWPLVGKEPCKEGLGGIQQTDFRSKTVEHSYSHPLGLSWLGATTISSWVSQAANWGQGFLGIVVNLGAT